MITFSIEEGRKIQQDQLKEWKVLLSAIAYDLLVKEIQEEQTNTFIQTGHDIIRGEKIYELLRNNVFRKLKHLTRL